MMDIYHKALKNPDPPKKSSTGNKTPPDYHRHHHQLQPPLHNPPTIPIPLQHQHQYQQQQQGHGQPMTLPPLKSGPDSNPVYLSHLTSIPQQGQIHQPQQINYNYTTQSNNNSNNNSITTNNNNINNNGNNISSTSENQLKDNVSKKKKNSRRKHRNSHLGCGTCKKRRIKCDETLPACLNCLKGKLHCAYLNLDNNARNALRIAQYNQNIRQDKLDANGKFIDELMNSVTTNNAGIIGNNVMPQPGLMSTQPQSQPQPITMALPRSGAIPVYSLSAATTTAPATAGVNTMAPNMTMSVAASAAAAANSANISPFINSVIAPGIQPPQNNSSQSRPINSAAGTVRSPPSQQQGPSPPQQQQQQHQQQQQQQPMPHLPHGHIPSPQIVQSPYGPLVPILTQTGSVVYAPTSSLTTQPPTMIATSITPQPQVQVIHPTSGQPMTLPPPIQGTTTIITTAQPPPPPPPGQLQNPQSLNNPSNVAHLSPVLSQKPSVVPITSNAGSVANIASQNIRLSVDKNEAAAAAAARKSEVASNVLPPINSNRSNSIDGKSPILNSITSTAAKTTAIEERSPIILPNIPQITPPNNNSNTNEDDDDYNNNNNNNSKKHSISSTTSSIKEETNNNNNNNVKLPSINILKREASTSPPTNDSSIAEEEKVSISKLLS